MTIPKMDVFRAVKALPLHERVSLARDLISDFTAGDVIECLYSVDPVVMQQVSEWMEENS